jgi:hypothetical protein
MRKIVLGISVLLVVAFAAYWRERTAHAPLDVVYVGEMKTTLWSTTAQVREPVVTLQYGDRLDVLNREGDYVQVRAEKGPTGWVEERQLMSSDLWAQAVSLNNESMKMPVEAVGHTKVISNLHADPGRDTARIRQITGGVPVELLARRVASVAKTQTAEGDDAMGPPESTGKKEDWWLVRAHPKDQGMVAGWILARFVELDMPAPLPDYASSANMRPIAWFVLNEVRDPSGMEKRQYLVAGTHGEEGQACDFTMIRAYTWWPKHQQYETAFIDNDLCGYLPLTIIPAAQPGGEVLFRFKALEESGPDVREYRMRQTIIRRIDTTEKATAGKRILAKKRGA